MDRIAAAVAATLVAAVPAAGAAAPPAAAGAQGAIRSALDASARAWNAGDLDRFMTCYEPSPATTYVSGARLVQGYGAIRAMYRDRFGGGSAAAMGQLGLAVLRFRLLDRDHAYVVGRFTLHRQAKAGGDASGLTTLLFHRTAGRWRIVADHS